MTSAVRNNPRVPTAAVSVARMFYDRVAATPDADRACFHVVAEAGDKERARELAEEFRDKIAGWRRDTT